MTTTINIRIAPRADTAANFTAANPVLALREFARETDTGKFKFGDGSTAWNSLPYWTGGGYSQAEIEEFARDALGAALVTGAGITITPSDGGDTITIACSITQYTDEMARDAIAAALVAGMGASLTVNDGADTITVAAAGGANQYTDAAGEYHLNATNAANLSTAATVANTLTLYPLIPLANAMTISALALYVTTGVAATGARLGIYADNGGKPDGGALLCDSGALDTATSSTAREGAVSLTLAKATRYWLAVLSDGAPTLRGIALGSTMPLPVSTDLSSTGVRNRRTASVTYGALPSTCPTTTKSTAAHVAIGLKIA